MGVTGRREEKEFNPMQVGIWNLNSSNCLNEIVKTYYLFSSAFITDGSVKFSPTPSHVYIKNTSNLYYITDINTDIYKK
jgi:hypothetical protein